MAHTNTHVWLRLRTLTFSLTLVALLAVPALTTSVSASEQGNVAVIEQSNETGNVTFDIRFSPSTPENVLIALLLPAVQAAREA